MFLKKALKKLSLQWRLTLMAAAVTAAACILLTVLIGQSATSKMDEIGNLIVDIQPLETGETISIENIEIAPEIYERCQTSKQNFQLHSYLTMLGIILASSLLTYFITGKSLYRLKEFSDNIENIQAQNLSKPVNSEELPKEIRRLCVSFNKMLARLDHSFATQKQFSANAAHELRTPLAVMQAKIDVFQKSQQHSEAEYQEILAMLNLQIERLSALVNELLEMTSLQTAERTDRIALEELAEEVLCDLEYLAQEKKICLIQTEGKAAFTGNETLIYRAIFNLVENAIKYNRADGKVTVSVNQTDGMAFLTVSDTGIGIPDEYQDSIFDPFFRVDKSRSRKMGGAGIGLAMVKMIAELHGGTVYVKSSSSKGSIITAEFPVI